MAASGSARLSGTRLTRASRAPARANARASTLPMPWLAPVTTASFPLRPKDGSLGASDGAAMLSGPPHDPAGGDVERMDVAQEPLLEWVGGVDLRTALPDDQVLLEPDAADARLA